MIKKQKESNYSLLDFLKKQNCQLSDRVKAFREYADEVYERNEMIYHREICSSIDREVIVRDPYTGKIKKMLMFGTNGYLGIANHPYLKEKIINCIDNFGSGLGGPRALGGSTSLHFQLEQKVAELKNKEDAIIFTSGFAANFGMATALLTIKDFVLMDEFMHASFVDGLLYKKAQFRTFRHNNIEHLEELLNTIDKNSVKDIYVVTESVFSMNGDIGKIDEILKLKKKFNFMLIVDDAHGLGVIGEKGHGVHEYFRTDGIDIIMGTFTKALAATGGYVAANKDIIQYMRYFARSYHFSTALPPVSIALVLGGLELLEKENWRVKKLRDNSKLCLKLLKENGIDTTSESCIIPVIFPGTFKIRKAGKMAHDKGIFLSTVEEPTVPKGTERFRISMMTNHTEEDINQLVKVLVEIFDEFK